MTDPVPRHTRRWFRRLAHDVRGATAIEYGLIAALIAVALIASFSALADATVGLWDNVIAEVTKDR